MGKACSILHTIHTCGLQEVDVPDNSRASYFRHWPSKGFQVALAESIRLLESSRVAAAFLELIVDGHVQEIICVRGGFPPEQSREDF